MAAPYTVLHGPYYRLSSDALPCLSDAIDLCVVLRKSYPSSQFPPRIVGDNRDADYPSGLSQDEQEIIQEAGLQ